MLAFEFFGGVPARLVPDNLKIGVDKPDLYDTKVNRSYAELPAPNGGNLAGSTDWDDMPPF